MTFSFEHFTKKFAEFSIVFDNQDGGGQQDSPDDSDMGQIMTSKSMPPLMLSENTTAGLVVLCGDLTGRESLVKETTGTVMTFVSSCESTPHQPDDSRPDQ
jgi:hypothetical protein